MHVHVAHASMQFNSQIYCHVSLQRGRRRGMDSVPSQGVTLADALDDYSSNSDGASFQPALHYDASLRNMLTTAAGFVLEALEKRGIKMATLLLTQMVRLTQNARLGMSPG